MGLDEEGYLSSDISAYPEKIRAHNAEYFKLFDKVHRFCHEKKFLVHAHNRDGQQIFAVGLFVKLICDVEAAVILMERGLSSQSRSMLRVATETLIKLANICKAYEFVEAYIKTGEHQRLLFVRGMKNNPAPAYEFILPELTDELIDEITKARAARRLRIGRAIPVCLSSTTCLIGYSHKTCIQHPHPWSGILERMRKAN